MDIARSKIAWSVTNELGAFVDCNDIFAKVAGFTREEVSRKTIFDLTLTRDLQKNMGVLSEMMSQDPADMPAQFLLRGISGERKPLMIILQLMRNESGANAGISCCILPQDATSPVLQNMQQQAQVEEEQEEEQEQPEQQEQHRSQPNMRTPRRKRTSLPMAHLWRSFRVSCKISLSSSSSSFLFVAAERQVRNSQSEQQQIPAKSQKKKSPPFGLWCLVRVVRASRPLRPSCPRAPPPGAGC